MNPCHRYQQTKRQNKVGKTQSGSQRYRFLKRGYKYTLEPKQHGYPDEIRKQALQLYVDSVNMRRIGRNLGLHHRTVSLWLKAAVASLPETPVPKEVKTAEMDELFTFIGNKKTGSTSSRLLTGKHAVI